MLQLYLPALVIKWIGAEQGTFQLRFSISFSHHMYLARVWALHKSMLKMSRARLTGALAISSR